MSLRPDDVGEGRLRVSLRNSSSALVGGLPTDTSSHPAPASVAVGQAAVAASVYLTLATCLTMHSMTVQPGMLRRWVRGLCRWTRCLQTTSTARRWSCTTTTATRSAPSAW